MFEKIGRYAENVATSPGLTRRGFFALTGKGALTLATLVGGLLLFPGEAAATKCTGGCTYQCPDGSHSGGGCNGNCRCDQTRMFRGMTCTISDIDCHAV